MTLHEQVTDILASAVEAQECAGISVLVRRCGEEMLYTQAGMSDVASGRLIHRGSIFRLYSQSKPITAAAVMLLAERGQIDLMDGVDRYLPSFRNARVVDKQGTIRPATRAPWLMELLGMTAGVCYPDSDPAGQYAAKVFDEATQEILAGGGVPTVEFCNRLGQQPLSFQPGTHWRYSTCADILGAVVEVVSGMRFGEFLRKEFFEPLDMVDTGFYVPESKRNRLVTAYKRTENGLVPWTSTHLAVGVYDREPAFESGGAGLVSTLEDYSHFADMLLAGGTYEGRRILSPATVACMTQPQLKDAVRRDMWDSLDGYSYGHLMRICAEPGRKKKGQGTMSLAESRGSASGGAWGNAPTVGRVTIPKEKSSPTPWSQAAKRPCAVTKNVSIKVKKHGSASEGVQRAIGKPSGCCIKDLYRKSSQLRQPRSTIILL